MGSNAFPRHLRLTRPEQFKRVFAKSRASNDHCFRVLARPNELDHARLGLAVSTRVCKRAVGRNRIKRLVRESFRAHQDLFGASAGDRGGLDLVVLPTRHAATICNRELMTSLARHWRRCLRFPVERTARAGQPSGQPEQGKN